MKNEGYNKVTIMKNKKKKIIIKKRDEEIEYRKEW